MESSASIYGSLYICVQQYNSLLLRATANVIPTGCSHCVYGHLKCLIKFYRKNKVGREMKTKTKEFSKYIR